MTRGTQGLTLIEVMIGITLLGVITLCLGQMSWLMTKGRQRIERRDLQYHAARVTLEKIAGDVGMAFLVRTPALKGTSAGAAVLETAFRGTDRGEADELDFTTLAGRRMIADAKESDQREVGYKVTTVPESKDLKQLVRRESRWIEGDVREGGETVTLIEGIRVFQLEYYDPVKGEWDTEWDSTDRVHQGILPAAVRITLQITDPNSAEQALTFTTVARLALSPGPVEF